MNTHGGCENSEVTDPSKEVIVIVHKNNFGATTTVEELIVRLGTIVFILVGGTGPGTKRNTGRTYDISEHSYEEFTNCKRYYNETIPLTAHVHLEYHAPFTSYDEAAHGKGLSHGKTLGDGR